MARVVIVGAGISGLAAAFRLSQRMPGIDLTILERNDRVGGTLWTLRKEGFQVEIGPNGFLDNKPGTIQLCRDLGLGDRLIQASEGAGKNRFLFLGDKLRALPGGVLPFVTSDLLSWRAKIGLLCERFRKKRTNAGDESIDAFARRRVGAEVAETLADAMVTGIYAGDPKLLSIQSCFPRVAAAEAEHGSVMKGFAFAAKQRRLEAKQKGVPYERPGKMWSFADGLRVLAEALRDRLPQPPLAGAMAQGLEKTGDPARPTWTVRGEGSQRWPADAVLLACPSHQQSHILEDVDSELGKLTGQIAYNRVAVVAFGFRQSDIPMSLDGFGFIAPQKLKRDLLGVQWCSSIFPQRAPDGCILLRAMCGGWNRADMVSWDDGRLIGALRAELKLAMKIDAAPIFHEIIRWDRAIPQYHLGHADRVAAIESRVAEHPGLFVGGNAYHGVALNDCTEQGVILAERIARYLGPSA